MKSRGRFIFDKRPSKERELNRLITLSKFYEPYTESILLNIKESFPKKIKKIIDIGAGTGHTTILLKKLFPSAEVTYFDYSNELLDYAKKNATEKKLNIKFERGDILSYPFDKDYDLIFSRFALKHFFNPKLSIKIMSNILNKNGIICLIEKDVYANIWYPKFPLYKTKFMWALNEYNKLSYRGGDSSVGRKMRNYLFLNGIDIKDEQLIILNLNNYNTPDIEIYKNIYIEVYENLVPELVANNLITLAEALEDIEKLRNFVNEYKNTAIIIDFVIWGIKNE